MQNCKLFLHLHFTFKQAFYLDIKMSVIMWQIVVLLLIFAHMSHNHCAKYNVFLRSDILQQVL